MVIWTRIANCRFKMSKDNCVIFIFSSSKIGKRCSFALIQHLRWFCHFNISTRATTANRNGFSLCWKLTLKCLIFGGKIQIFEELKTHTLFKNYWKCRIWIFEFWHFPPFFVVLEITSLVTLFDRKLQVFKNSPKRTIFGIFN